MRRAILTAIAAMAIAVPASADPLNCLMGSYTPTAGITASVADDVLTLAWDGDAGQQLRLRLAIDTQAPVIREVAVRAADGVWHTVAEGLTPTFSITTGLRRISNQQLTPLRQAGVEITSEIVDRYKWDVFWDAPLDLNQDEPAAGGNPPPRDGIAHQPGLPRNKNEVRQDTIRYALRGCEVRTDGARLEASFTSVSFGTFTGRLQFTVYRGTNLVRAEVIAQTQEPSVAFKYEAGLRGLPAVAEGRLAWRDLSNAWQGVRVDRIPQGPFMPLKTANRLVIAEGASGSIAAFPPPHTFFWAREVETNLGYAWHRRDGTSYSFGIRQADGEEEPRYRANFSLYSAPPGTFQRMPMYLYVTAGRADAAFDGAMAFTRGDRYKPLDGYQVMANHFHMDMGARLLESGSLDTKLPDLQALEDAGINIVSPTDRPNGEDRLEVLEAFFEGAKRNSNDRFMVLPAEEVSQLLGGHWDLVFPKPVFWTRDRQPGQPLVEDHPKHGRVYRVGSPEDVMEMVRRENGLIFMPHPRTKGSTGYPDVIKDTPHFRDPAYRGVGWRWGMGLDLSERRLSEKRVLPLLDDMNNWIADLPGPLKFIQAITETYRKQPGDDIYANNPVNYVRLAKLPPPDEATPIIDAMSRGDFFVTSGEVLITNWQVQGTGPLRTVFADVEWTFPMEFVEVVWGDGTNVDRRIVSATNFPPFGRGRFAIPFPAEGKKWVRFAAWDSAGNGALVQPIRVQP